MRLRKTDLFKRSLCKSVRRYGNVGYFAEMDALALLKGFTNSVADLIFLDPPFNLGKAYGNENEVEDASPEEYASYMFEVLDECARILKDGGTLFLYHLPYWGTVFSAHLNTILSFRHWIAVSMKNGFARGDSLYPAHYALLYYSKGPPETFQRPRISPQICKTCGGYAKDYGGYRPIIEEKGVNLSDIWEDISPVRHKARSHRQQNELPVRFTDRMIAIAGSEEKLIVDPFAGSGSAVVSAVRAGMRFVANDIHAENLTIIKGRLAAKGGA